MESRQTTLEQAIEEIRQTQQQMQQQMLQMQQQIPQILQALPPIQEQLRKLQLQHGYRRRQRQQQPLRVWQWNSRGLDRKRGNLQLHIRIAEHMPGVLAFQESHNGVHLSGYVRFEVPVEAAVRGPRASKPVQTFDRRGIPTIQHEPVVDNVPHILLELLPRRKEQRRVFLHC
ncbi:hypothetical protein ISCGN_011422 [Ixodes scapularis]